MELTTAILVIVLTYFIAVISRWAFNRFQVLQEFKRCGIPGPTPSFIFGNYRELMSKPTQNEIITRWLQTYGNVLGFFVGGIPFVVVKDIDIIKQVFIKDFHKFTNRPDLVLDVSPLNRTLIALKSKRWKEVRSVITPTFSSSKIKLMSHIFNKKVDITVDIISKKVKTGEMFNMYELVQGLTLDVIADCALAMKTHCQENSQDQLLIAVQQFFRLSHNSAVAVGIIFPFVSTIMTFISDYMTAGKMTSLIVDNVNIAIATRRRNPSIKSLDFLQMILDHERDAKEGDVVMTNEEIVANAYIFLLAGYETTATSLAFAFYMLVMHPELQERLYNEVSAQEHADYDTIQSMKYLDQFFSETLRFYPPVTGFITRQCNEECKVGNYTIPLGAVVQAPIWDIHHDPELWPDPWKFDPDRFSEENKSQIRTLSHFPFGIGPRNCIGARFAQLEAKLTLFRLLKKFRFEKCELTEDPLQLVCPTVITTPANGIYLKAVARDS